jgi:hypothetical protein
LIMMKRFDGCNKWFNRSASSSICVSHVVKAIGLLF